jgi:redox-sensitive bicupin YhaK (pirin superfamily)
MSTFTQQGTSASLKARQIRQVLNAPSRRHGTELVTTDATSDSLGEDMDPFIVVSLYEMTGPTFPPHPHAGFAVATYMLPESSVGFVNQDSLGNVNAIPPGALHITVAGSGVIHEEQPAECNKVARGFQIWIDLPNDLREVAPHAIHVSENHIPVAQWPGVSARVVLGSLGKTQATTKLPTNIRIIDVTMASGARFTQDLLEQENAFIFMHTGDALVNGILASTGQLVRTAADGERLELFAQDHGARFTLFAGLPLSHSRAQRGPFVASDDKQLARFASNFNSGRFGKVVPFAASALNG